MFTLGVVVFCDFSVGRNVMLEGAAGVLQASPRTPSDLARQGYLTRCSNKSFFIDLTKALDPINQDILIDKLQNYGVRCIASSLIKLYLLHRKQFVTNSFAIYSTECVYSGVPQGSTLGTLLFIICINDVLSSVHYLCGRQECIFHWKRS